MSEELKGCPFCGKPPVVTADTDVTDGFVHSYTIACYECGFHIGDEYRDDVSAAWNRRHQEQDQSSTFERCMK